MVQTQQQLERQLQQHAAQVAAEARACEELGEMVDAGTAGTTSSAVRFRDLLKHTTVASQCLCLQLQVLVGTDEQAYNICRTRHPDHASR